MIVDFESGDVETVFESETIIVGGGAVGLSMAAEFAARGRKVLLLEAGGASLETRSQDIFLNANSTGIRLEGLHSGRFRLFGGSTNFWGGQVLPLDSIVFEERDWVNSAGWPFGYDVLAPYYKRAMSMLDMDDGISQDTNVWKRAKTIPPEFADDIELFFGRHVKNRNFAKLFRKTLSSDKVSVVLHANVIGFSPDENQRHIAHFRTMDGRRGTARADQIVLACGTLEISRLLLLPYVDGRPTAWSENAWVGKCYIDHLDVTLGEVFPKDRRFFDIFESLFFDGYKYTPRIKLSAKAQRTNKLLGISATFIYRTSYKDNIEALRMFVGSLREGKWPAGIHRVPRHLVTLLRIALPLVWRFLRTNRTFHPSGSSILLRGTAELIPMQNSRITLRKEIDALGMPMINVHWAIDGRELDTMAFLARKIQKALKDANLGEVKIDPRLMERNPAVLREGNDTYHQMGGARMGGTAMEGVVDRDLRVFGTSDIFVAGASVMPTTGFPNCTLTAIALGLRLCDHLAK